MPSRARKPGCTEPVEYFVNALGHHIISPYTGARPPDGYIVHYVDTLPDIRRLQSTLQAQEMALANREIAEEIQRKYIVDQRVRDSIHRQLASSNVSEWEKDYLREWLKVRDEKKDKKYTDIYLQHTLYLWALENDTHKARGADQEIVMLDRITY